MFLFIRPYSQMKSKNQRKSLSAPLATDLHFAHTSQINEIEAFEMRSTQSIDIEQIWLLKPLHTLYTQ